MTLSVQPVYYWCLTLYSTCVIAVKAKGTQRLLSLSHGDTEVCTIMTKVGVDNIKRHLLS